jgi:protein-tyrosine phosphatase
MGLINADVTEQVTIRQDGPIWRAVQSALKSPHVGLSDKPENDCGGDIVTLNAHPEKRPDDAGGYAILFVCMGNICRSPTAEIVFRKMLARQAPELPVEVDSAGTGGYHVGSSPDARAMSAALRRGYDMSALKARVFEADDFRRFDLILAMDRENLAALRRLAPPSARDRLRLFLEFAPEAEITEVPDPYYGGPNGFEEVLDLVEAASQGLLKFVRARKLGLTP